MNLTFFFIILTILHIYSTLWAEKIPSPIRWQLGVYFTPYDLPKNTSNLPLRGGGARGLLDYNLFVAKGHTPKSPTSPLWICNNLINEIFKSTYCNRRAKTFGGRPLAAIKEWILHWHVWHSHVTYIFNYIGKFHLILCTSPMSSWIRPLNVT